MSGNHINTLIEGILALDEPWQGRFLALLATRANEKGHMGHPQSRENVVRWLRDTDIYQEFAVLLDKWQGIKL